MNPTTLGVVGPGFLNQVRSLHGLQYLGFGFVVVSNLFRVLDDDSRLPEAVTVTQCVSVRDKEVRINQA